MAISAFILVDVKGDHTKSVYTTIRRIEGVKSLYLVTGAHDLIILIEADTIDTMGNLILSKIRSIDGVIKTRTSIVLSI